MGGGSATPAHPQSADLVPSRCEAFELSFRHRRGFLASRLVLGVAAVPKHPDFGFKDSRCQQFSSTVSRRNTGIQGFQFKRRYTNCPPVRIIWQGIFMITLTNVRNSIFNNLYFSARCFDAQRPFSGSHNANQALRFHANDVITM